ncbi:uncharacterized protein CLUP02_10222 [Colletotrichum lupini]|uniref:Uncharacterized protein n=1 Tax=Colletotrichum lupini TaxID=145971 RepID=A0A9Q8WIP2_9PEZI|nr:uncharacterized protein CLUP02_10222 [Colletotrichum lupini]UQC84726.1 hypothetical protein CLUP02_10222 [Colletotrichum lupini]
MQTVAEHSGKWPNALLLREGERRQFPNRTSAFPPCQFPISAGVPVRLAPPAARVRKKAASDPFPHPVSSRALASQGHGTDGRWEFGKASEDPPPAPRLAQLGQPAKTTQRTGHSTAVQCHVLCGKGELTSVLHFRRQSTASSHHSLFDYLHHQVFVQQGALKHYHHHLAPYRHTVDFAGGPRLDPTPASTARFVYPTTSTYLHFTARGAGLIFPTL